MIKSKSDIHNWLEQTGLKSFSFQYTFKNGIIQQFMVDIQALTIRNTIVIDSAGNKVPLSQQRWSTKRYYELEQVVSILYKYRKGVNEFLEGVEGYA